MPPNALAHPLSDGEGAKAGTYVESIRWFRTAARGGHTFGLSNYLSLIG